MNSVQVQFRNSDLDYRTSINPKITEQEAKDYFIGKEFNLGIYPNEEFHKCINISFGNSLTLNEKLKEAGIKTIREGKYVYLQKGDIKIHRPNQGDLYLKINKAFNVNLIKDEL